MQATGRVAQLLKPQFACADRQVVPLAGQADGLTNARDTLAATSLPSIARTWPNTFARGVTAGLPCPPRRRGCNGLGERLAVIRPTSPPSPDGRNCGRNPRRCAPGDCASPSSRRATGAPRRPPCGHGPRRPSAACSRAGGRRRRRLPRRRGGARRWRRSPSGLRGAGRTSRRPRRSSPRRWRGAAGRPRRRGSRRRTSGTRSRSSPRTSRPPRHRARRRRRTSSRARRRRSGGGRGPRGTRPAPPPST
mmetsp:Transcript_101523/g.282873  ORF Transcript_101523/g.282873 Transcript_101523/m.282873 type:complete len:249 (+) Transcript_101523:381-1127(+)